MNALLSQIKNELVEKNPEDKTFSEVFKEIKTKFFMFLDKLETEQQKEEDLNQNAQINKKQPTSLLKSIEEKEIKIELPEEQSEIEFNFKKLLESSQSFFGIFKSKFIEKKKEQPMHEVKN